MFSACKALLLGALVGAAPAEPLQIPAGAGQATLAAHWYPLPGAAPKPAVLALHGCGGLYQRDGTTLDARYPAYRQLLAELGVQLLLTDSWGSRGLGPQCSIRPADRKVSVADRRADALAALDWLRRQAGVDPQRIALLGWSHGGTTGLTVIDSRRSPQAPPLAAVALYYPGCAKQRQAGAPAMPLLLQLGAADDWTPAAPCEQLAARWQSEGAAVQRISYAGAFHGFDSARPVRLRTDVPHGVNPTGVHQGGDPAARAASLTALRHFLTQHLKLNPALNTQEAP